MEGSVSKCEPSALKAHIVDGSCLRSEPSTPEADIMEGSPALNPHITHGRENAFVQNAVRVLPETYNTPKAEYPDRNLPEAKVKREESPTASSPQRLIFSRRRPYIPAAVPCHHPMPSQSAISSRNAMSCLKALPSCNSSRQGCHATAIHIGYTLSRCSGIGLI